MIIHCGVLSCISIGNCTANIFNSSTWCLKYWYSHSKIFYHNRFTQVDVVAI